MLLGKQCRKQKPRKQEDKEGRFNDKSDTPRIPRPPERPERAHAVVVGEVEQDVAEAGDVGEQKQQSPARRKIRNAGLASAQPPDEIHESDHDRADEKQSKK